MPAKRASTAKSASTVMSASTTKRVRGASRSCTAKRLCTSPECRQEKEELAARMERMRMMARSAMVRYASRTTNLHRHLVTSLLGGAATDLPREQILAKKAEVAALKHEIAKSQRYMAGQERLFTHPLNDEGAVMGREKMEELMEENRLIVEAREDEVRQAEREVVTMVLGQEVQEDRRATTEEQEATNEELEATTEELEATNEKHVPSIEEQGVMVPVEERQGNSFTEQNQRGDGAMEQDKLLGTTEVEEDPVVLDIIQGEEVVQGEEGVVPEEMPRGSLTCRTVRLGNIKVLRLEGVARGTSGGLMCRVPFRASPGTLAIRLTDITKVLAAFGKSMPLLFLYLRKGLCVNIRQQLQMADTEGASQGEVQDRITVILERNTKKEKDELKQHFQDKLQEINMKEAIEILVRPSPCNIATLKANMMITEDINNQKGVAVEQEQQFTNAMEEEVALDQQQEQPGGSRGQEQGNDDGMKVGQESAKSQGVQKTREAQEGQKVRKPARGMVRREREGRWAVVKEAAIPRGRGCIKVEVVGEVVEECQIKEYSEAEVEGPGRSRRRRELCRHTSEARRLGGGERPGRGSGTRGGGRFGSNEPRTPR